MRDLDSPACLRAPSAGNHTKGSRPRHTTDECPTQMSDDCSNFTGERMSVREASFCDSGLIECSIGKGCPHGQRSDPMGRVTARGHPTESLVDAKRGLLERDPRLDQRQNLGHRRSGIEGTFPPPVEVTPSDVGNVHASVVAETLGNSDSHPHRATNPVARRQSEQDPDNSIFASLHPFPSVRLTARMSGSPRRGRPFDSDG